jgi:S1-C subfamily serine protease
VYVLVAVLAAALGAGAVLALRSQPSGSSAAPLSQQHVPQPRNNPPGNTSPVSGINQTAVANKVDPGLVDITSYVHLQRQVFEGTGMVLTPTGLVLTNNHVIKGSTRVVVTLVTTGREYKAEVLGTDNSQDVALLQLINASGLKTVQVGDSSKVTKDTPVVALGNAGGVGGLPARSTGRITGLDEKITATDAGSGTSEVLTHMFQTDAPIAEGDSGGALANAAGQVIAMNTAANSQPFSNGGTSQGFSIPINRALGIAHLITAGKASSTIKLGLPAFLGIEIASNPHNAALASTAASPQQQLRQLQTIAGPVGGVNSSGRCLADGTANPVPNSIARATSGTLIAGVFCNAPAAAAGAQAGDVITAVNGHSVSSPASLRTVMSQYRPGTTVSMTWVSVSGGQRTGSVKLAPGPAA